MNMEYLDIWVTVALVVVVICWILVWNSARKKEVYPREVIKKYALCAVLFTIISVIRIKIAQALEKANMVPFYLLLIIGIIACMWIFYSYLRAKQDAQNSKEE